MQKDYTISIPNILSSTEWEIVNIHENCENVETNLVRVQKERGAGNSKRKIKALNTKRGILWYFVLLFAFQCFCCFFMWFSCDFLSFMPLVVAWLCCDDYDDVSRVYSRVELGVDHPLLCALLVFIGIYGVYVLLSTWNTWNCLK